MSELTSLRHAKIEDRIRQKAKELGFTLVGIAAPEPSTHMGFYRNWIESGAQGEMAYLARLDAMQRRADLTLTMSEARSVVIVAHEYYGVDRDGAPADPAVGVIARYARGRDYHRVVKGKLVAMLRWLEEEMDGRLEGRAYVDTGPLLERDLGRRAGLGWFGRNTMLIHPRRGSWFFLGCLMLDLELEPDPPFGADHCGTCRACLDACPTGALLGRDEDGAPVLDARLCISYLTIEHRGPIPHELRPLMGNRVFGCDICQDVCPFNREATETHEPGYAARGPGERPVGVQSDGTSSGSTHPGTSAPRLVDLLRMSRTEWAAFSRGSAIGRAGFGGFRRNVAVALGNWGHEDAVPALGEAVADDDPLVRGHAAWALGQVGSDGARARLVQRRQVEQDDRVREELTRALDP